MTKHKRSRLSFFFGRTPVFFVLMLLLAAITGGIALAQEQEEEAPAPALPVLEFRSYDSGWLRYRNNAADGAAALALEDVTEFPFRHVIGATLLKLADLQDAESLAEQIAAAGVMDESLLQYDEEDVDGSCNTAKLSPSRDVLCVPGSSALPDGSILLVLFHPETMESVALTTSIDNNFNAAARADWGQAPADSAEPMMDDSAASGCGPYAVGQWILASEYDAAGLNLAVKSAGACPVTAYNCYQPDDGEAYLQAHCESADMAPPPVVMPVEDEPKVDCSRDPDASNPALCG